MLCPFHEVEMQAQPERDRRVAPLHRCPICTEEFRVKFKRALGVRRRGGCREVRQRVSPIIPQWERWL